ncbi:CPBP family intramembrane glutamic endopeptidase [Streptomyces sp. NPDC001851]|uniref:CPBP family intramembrane glutamic endopeptidase n=1 Tax=Streptomyces sp. NPDC001851 TaxID=3154529 RepID=UPI003323EEAB
MRTTRTRPTTRPGGRWAAPAGVYLTVAFLAAGALGAVQPATGVPGEVVQLTQFGPALGVATAALLWPARTRGLLGGTGARSDSRWPLLATPFLIIALSAGPYALLSGSPHLTDPRSLHHPFPLIAVAQLAGACGEEIGWRCFLQPLLRTRFRPLTASVAVGAVWGLWHVQVLAQAPAYTAGFLLATIAMSVVLGLALEQTGGRVRLLLAGGFHTLVNLGMLLFMDEETGAALPMVLFGLACAVVAGAWAGRGRGVTIPATGVGGNAGPDAV